MSKFEAGKSYYCRFHEHMQLKVVSRSDDTVTVKGWKISRHKIMTDRNGNEYIEIGNPIEGLFRYPASNLC